MRNFLQNLQNKSESTKRVIMWFSVISIMATVFIFWLFTFQWSVGAPENTNPSLDKLPGVWQSFKEQLNNLGNLWQK